MAAGAPSQELCAPWATTADLPSPCDDYALDSALMEDFLDISSSVLFELTGRRWPGTCRETVRPLTERWLERDSFGSVVGPRASACCGQGIGCSCGSVSEVVLPGYPVVRIVTVKVDGDTVASTEYRVDDYRRLVGLTPSGGVRRIWPRCQRLDLADTEVGTFSVTYDYGVAPPLGGVHAAAALACELYRASQPETFGSCQLAPNVTSVVREGVSIEVSSVADAIGEGRTGIPVVDLWLGSVRYGRAHRPGTVMVPGAARRARRSCC